MPGDEGPPADKVLTALVASLRAELAEACRRSRDPARGKQFGVLHAELFADHDNADH